MAFFGKKQAEQPITKEYSAQGGPMVSGKCETNGTANITCTTPAEHIVIDFSDSIRIEAYCLWEDAGRPDGRSDEFWVQAEEKIFSYA